LIIFIGDIAENKSGYFLLKHSAAAFT